MGKYDSYYKILDEIRISKGIKISTLCEGIVSERTYLRNIKNGDNIKFNIFYQLLKKLNIELPQFMTYMISYENQDFDSNSFVVKVYTKHYEGIEKKYEAMLNYTHENVADKAFVKTYLTIYEYQTNKITEEEFGKVISECLESIKDLKNSNFMALHIRLLSKMFLGDKEESYQIAEYLLLNKSVENYFYYLLTIDLFLYWVMLNDLINIELFQKLLNKINNPRFYFYIKYFEINVQIYKSYIYFKTGKYEEAKQSMLKVLVNSKATQSEALYLEKQGILTHIFGLDINKFYEEEIFKITQLRRYSDV